MTQEEFEDAVVARIVAESGLAAGKVIWQDQTRKRPSRPFIGLRIMDAETPVKSEDRQTDNPEVAPNTPASMDLGVNFPELFGPGSLLTVGPLAAEGALGNDVTFATVMDGGDGFGIPRITWNPTTLELVAHCDAGYSGNTVAAALGTWIAGDGDGYFIMDPPLALNDPQTDPLGPFNFEGGVFPEDPLIISNIDHKDVTVQLIAYTSEVTGNNRAYALLNRVHRKLGSERAQDAFGDIAIIGRRTVRDVSVELENESEGRAVMALDLRFNDTNAETANMFETVEVETTIERTNDTVTKTVTYKNE